MAGSLQSACVLVNGEEWAVPDAAWLLSVSARVNGQRRRKDGTYRLISGS